MSAATNASPVRPASRAHRHSLCLTQRCCYTRPHSATRADGRRTSRCARRRRRRRRFAVMAAQTTTADRATDSLLLRAAWLHARRHRERGRRTRKGRGPQIQAPCVCAVRASGGLIVLGALKCSTQPAHVPIIDSVLRELAYSACAFAHGLQLSDAVLSRNPMKLS